MFSFGLVGQEYCILLGDEGSLGLDFLSGLYFLVEILDFTMPRPFWFAPALGEAVFLSPVLLLYLLGASFGLAIAYALGSFGVFLSLSLGCNLAIPRFVWLCLAFVALTGNSWAFP